MHIYAAFDFLCANIHAKFLLWAIKDNPILFSNDSEVLASHGENW